MAIDTVAKRASALSFMVGVLLPVPDGTVAQADRQTLRLLYGGILATSGTVAGPYSCEASEVFQAGAVMGEAFQAGKPAGETFQAGSATGEVI